MRGEWCVYKITNKINGHLYIGKTIADTSRRWRDHISINNLEDCVQAIQKAILKYGSDNFNFEVIKYYKTENAAYRGEIFYIKKYNTYLGEGYNQTPGGKGVGVNRRKLSNQQAKLLIKNYIYHNFSVKDLVKTYQLAKPSVLDILNRRSYLDIKISENLRYLLWLKIHRNVYQEMDKTNCNFLKLKQPEIKDIFRQFAIGNCSLTNLAKKFNTTISNIIFILNRQTHANIKIDKRTLTKVNNLLLKIKKPQISKNDRYFIKNNIFKDFERGLLKSELADKYNLKLNRIVKILNNSIWKNIGLEPSLLHLIQSKITQISDDKALLIINDYKNNLPIKELSNKYSVNELRIKNILNGKSFKHLKVENFPNKKLAYEAEVRYINGHNKTTGGDCGPVKLKYNVETLINIINDYCDGIKLKEISIKYDIVYHAVFDITRLRISKSYYLPQEILDRLKLTKSVSNKRFAKTTSDDVMKIIELFLSGKTINQIANKFSLTDNTVWNLLHRKTWTEINIGTDLEMKLKEKLSGSRYWKRS